MIGLSNGREVRWRAVDSVLSERFLQFGSEKVRVLGDYEAYQFTDERVFEAFIAPNRMTPPYLIGTLPGVRALRQLALFANEDEEGSSPLGETDPLRDAWILPFSNPYDLPLSIEIRSTPSEQAATFCDQSLLGRTAPAVVIRIEGVDAERHDDALTVFNQITDAVFFELDLRYGMSFAVRRDRGRLRYAGWRMQTRIGSPPQVPKTQYRSEPLSLYVYGRSASRMPLLQFLAFYQVLEYYFPSYSCRETLDKLRLELRDPRFELEDDIHLARVLALAAKSGRGYGKEREHLQATIRGCVTEEVLKDYLEVDERKDYFSGKETVKGVPRIDLKNERADVRDVVATRVYALRCRVVHSKDDGGDQFPDLLLPFSSEADELGPDIDLVGLLAQKALIAGGSPLGIG